MKIKRTKLSLALSISIITQISCNSSEITKDSVENFSIITFDSTTISLGPISDSEIVKRVIKFRNSSDVPLYIKGVKGTCGCTTISFPKDRIIGSDSIEFSFDPKGQDEHPAKSIFIYSNTIPEVTEIKFTATIKK